MDPASDWRPIESDPGVFGELIRRFGVRGVQVEQMWSIDDGIFENLRPVHGLIFLFKYLQYEGPSNYVVTDPDRLNTIYFAKQVVRNACASTGLINLLLNCNHIDVWLGPRLCNFQDASMSIWGLNPQMRGTALCNSQWIKDAHNSLSGVTNNEFSATEEENAFHFIGYIPRHGRLYELDGLRDGPIDHGPIAPEQDWLDVVRPIILTRMYRYYVPGEIRYNLMALVSDRKMVLEREIDEIIEDPNAQGMNEDEVECEIRNRLMLIEQEDAKKWRYQQEIARRCSQS